MAFCGIIWNLISLDSKLDGTYTLRYLVVGHNTQWHLKAFCIT